MDKDLKNQLETHLDEIEDNEVTELSKLLNIGKNNYKITRDLIVKSEFTLDKKLKYLDCLEVLFTMKNKTLKTSDYDNKPYSMLFFNNFLDFLNNNNLSQNEFKVCLAVYSILNELNTFGNVLLSMSNKVLADKTKISITNISKVIKSLTDKNVLKRNDGYIYLNCSLFFRGSKIEYDTYNRIFEELENKID